VIKNMIVKTKTDAVIEDLGSRIVSGALDQGEVLSPEELRTCYGVSRTVVREAVQVLKAKGLLTVHTQRGTVVSAHGSWNLLDPDVVRWLPEGGWLWCAALEYQDEIRMLAAAKPHNAVLDYAVRSLPRMMTDGVEP
jgi:biotin operon repressor